MFDVVDDENDLLVDEYDDNCHSGPGFWVLSQALLLLYFKMDNGSNVCGIEFNYDNEEKEEEEAKKEGGSRGEGGGQGGGEKDDGGGEGGGSRGEGGREEENGEGQGGGEEEDDPKSLIGADVKDSEMYYNNEIMHQLFLGFQVKSEAGRSVFNTKMSSLRTI